jgi:hypothetical protein
MELVGLIEFVFHQWLHFWTKSSFTLWCGLFAQWNSLFSYRILDKQLLSVGWGDVSELATNGPIVHTPGDTWGWEPCWNDIDGGKLNNFETNLSHCHFVQKSHMGWPGHESGPPWWETGVGQVNMVPSFTSNEWVGVKFQINVWMNFCLHPLTITHKLYSMNFLKNGIFTRYWHIV